MEDTGRNAIRAARRLQGQAVALYDMMHAHGATHLRLIIGKRTPSSRSTHAWLEWETEDGTYLLDPTWNWKAYASREVRPRSYIPYYAFEGSEKFRATTTALVAQN